MAELEVGTVVQVKNGYGFIAVPDEPDTFFHFSLVEPATWRPAVGDKAEFEAIEGPRGRRALRVMKVEG